MKLQNIYVNFFPFNFCVIDEYKNDVMCKYKKNIDGKQFIAKSKKKYFMPKIALINNKNDNQILFPCFRKFAKNKYLIITTTGLMGVFPVYRHSLYRHPLYRHPLYRHFTL